MRFGGRLREISSLVIIGGINPNDYINQCLHRFRSFGMTSAKGPRVVEESVIDRSRFRPMGVPRASFRSIVDGRIIRPPRRCSLVLYDRQTHARPRQRPRAWPHGDPICDHHGDRGGLSQHPGMVSGATGHHPAQSECPPTCYAIADLCVCTAACRRALGAMAPPSRALAHPCRHHGVGHPRHSRPISTGCNRHAPGTAMNGQSMVSPPTSPTKGSLP